MDEAQRLQQSIDYWQGRIGEHLQQQKHGSHGYSARWSPRRGSPYGVRNLGQLRGGTGPYRNKTLVVNHSTNGDPTISLDDHGPLTSGSAQKATQFVSTHGRHKQLINSNIYDRVTQQRNKDMKDSWTARRQEKAAKEAARLQKFFAESQAHKETQLDEVEVDGIRFRISDGGSKLMNISNLPAERIPQRTVIGGVTFFRSKNGNLYRAGIVRSKRWVDGDERSRDSLTSARLTSKSADLCPTFSSSGNISLLHFLRGHPFSSQRAANFSPGSCPHGPTCHFTHDPEKVAICKDFLQKGTCPAGDYCDLSHDPSPHRTPACNYFIRGKCTNEACRYAHVRVNPGAAVCRAFATCGYCDKGSTCAERHVTECPDHANKGVCHNLNCRLPHVDRAGKLRKAATSASAGDMLFPEKIAIEESSSDDDDQDVLGNIDSDEDVFIQGAEGAGHDLAGNRDFVGF